MTQLDCSVTSCLYNQDHYCAKEDITVGGSNAKKASLLRKLQREKWCAEQFHRICDQYGKH